MSSNTVDEAMTLGQFREMTNELTDDTRLVVEINGLSCDARGLYVAPMGLVITDHV